MTKQEFRNLSDRGILILDGATGTQLQKAGMPANVCPEQWILEHQETMIQLQRAYVAAGTNILYTPTFTANRIKLAEYGLAEHLVEMNTRLVQISKTAADGRAFVAGDMTMTGKQMYPLGDMLFEDCVNVYKEQAKALVKAGVDLFVVETMMSLQETRAAILAIQEVCDLPIMASLTFEANGRTLFGTDPATAVVVLQSLGVDAVGLNCSTGPLEMIEIVTRMYQYANLPILAKPNAGLPELEDGTTVYKTTPQEFAEAAKQLAQAGARILGGCCGTSPEHIKALAEAIQEMSPAAVSKEKRRILASERKIVEIDLNGTFQVIGERINPTGKKKLQAQLREGNLDLACSMAREQETNGANILDINVGMNGIDEKQMMLEAIYEVTAAVDCPLCIDSSNVDVIEAALRIYPGRALVNSVSLEKEKFERLLPIVRRYGAMFILLPLSDEGLPKTLIEKRKIVDTIVAEALRQGFSKEDIIVDGLVATVGANPQAALECFDTIHYCKNECGLATVCGLSNISFGLPERMFVNTAFLTMAIAQGLTMAIANPSQDLLMNAAAAADMLLQKQGSDLRYIHRIQQYQEKQKQAHPVSNHPSSVPAAAGAGAGRDSQAGVSVGTSRDSQIAAGAGAGRDSQADKSAGLGRDSQAANAGAGRDSQTNTEADLQSKAIYRAVLQGEKNSIVNYAKEELANGKKPDQVINQYLIPAIQKVGEFFDQQKYFLPQLIASANAMKEAIEYLEPLIERSGDKMHAATIVVATVEGDIHDIGKNLVVLMLRNYGYQVIDLGKDVCAEKIVSTAIQEGAKVIGLSALMTTTMLRMQDVVKLAKERKYKGSIIIGGAAITPSFAKEIGADGYSKDAAACVKLVAKILADETEHQ